MTVAELIALLEEYPAHAEVRVAYQPTYPMELHLSGRVGDMPGEAIWLGTTEQGDYLAGSVAQQVFN